jgi:ABC-2 type transport system permease protein
VSTSSVDRDLRRAGGPTMPRVLASELLKLGGLRSPVVLVVVASAFVVLLGPVNAVGQVVAPDRTEPLRTVGEALSLVLTGVTNAALAVGVLGVLSVTNEYASGSIRTSLGAVPRRAALVLGKALALAAILLPVALVSLVIAFEVGRRILHQADVGLGWTDPDVIRVLLATTWYVVGWALLGQTLAWLLRSAVGASFALLGVMFVLPALTTLVPGRAAESIRELMVSEAGAAMVRTEQAGSGLGPFAGALVWTLYLAVGVGIAVLTTSRRDA